MSRTVSLRVWILVLVVLLSNMSEPGAVAELSRGRRSSCGRPAMGKPCCPQPYHSAPRVAAGMCVIDELYALPGMWIYYAHCHENEDECADYVGMVYQSSVERSPVPMMCDEDQCFDPGARAATKPGVGLPVPITASEDLARLMPNSQATKIDETAGNLVLPDGRRIHARIGFYKVNVPMNIGGVQREVTDYFAFGFEAEDTGNDGFEARDVDYHSFATGAGEQVQRNLVEFKIGTTECVVLTVKL